MSNRLLLFAAIKQNNSPLVEFSYKNCFHPPALMTLMKLAAEHGHFFPSWTSMATPYFITNSLAVRLGKAGNQSFLDYVKSIGKITPTEFRKIQLQLYVGAVVGGHQDLIPLSHGRAGQTLQPHGGLN